MKIRQLTPKQTGFPERYTNLPQPPKQIYIYGDNFEELMQKPLVAIVGSRKASNYGRAVTEQLAGELAYLGVVIVSGLALGIDSVAHKAALDNGGQTIAVLPSGLDKIYPSTHAKLAEEIVKKGGALITEYPDRTEPRRENFIARNRLIAGLSQGTLITEAALKSGSFHTARFALEQGSVVMAVPGNITSYLSEGANNLIKSGAVPITSAQDVLNALGLKKLKVSRSEALGASFEEQIILDLIKSGKTEISELIALSQLRPEVFNQTLTMLEINGQIRPLGGGQWVLHS